MRYPALVALVFGLAGAFAFAAGPAAAAASACPYPLTDANRPVAPPHAASEEATFTDATAVVRGSRHVRVAERDYIAPFATLVARSAQERVCIEEGSNVQDNTVLVANGGPVLVGEHAIVAHGANLIGADSKVSIAHRDACPLPEPGTEPATISDPAAAGRQALANALAEAGMGEVHCDEVPAFISFNALNRSHIEDGALLGAAGRLAPGVILRSGYASLPGKSLDTQAQADDPALGEVRFVNAGDIIFMEAVLHVNECLARGYTAMYRADGSSILGINWDPGAFHGCEFNHSTEAPTIGGEPVRDPDPEENIRIIGDARIGDIDGISDFTSIRADEGEPFLMGEGIEWGFGTTFHALEPTAEDPEVGVTIGDDVEIGPKAIVHGGGRRPRAGGPGDEPTTIRAGSTVGAGAVVFRSDLFEDTRVGFRAVLVAYDSSFPGEVIPPRCVKFVDTPPNECAYFVEW